MAFFERVLQFRWVVLASILFACIIAIVGGKNLYFRSDYQAFFSEKNDHLIAFETLQNTYTKTDNVLFVLHAKESTIYNQSVFEAIKWLTEQAWQIPYSIRVDSLSNFQHTKALEDDLIVEDLIESTDNLLPADYRDIRQIVENEPLLIKRLANTAGDVTAINVVIQAPDLDANEALPSIIAKVRSIRDEFVTQYPGIDVYLNGMVMLNNSFVETSISDNQLFFPLMFATILVMLGWILRTVAGALITSLVILLSVMSAYGLAGWLGIAITGPSSAGGSIIMTLAVADCVHVLTTFMQVYASNQNKKAAILESLRINLQPIFLTTLTTAIGFLSMNFSDAPPFHDLGNIVAMGVTVAFILSVTVLPALLYIAPIKAKAVREFKLSRLSQFVIRRKSLLLIGMSALSVIGLLGIQKNTLNDDFVQYFDTRIPFRVAADFTAEKLTGLHRVDYSLDSGEKSGINNPEFLDNVEAFSDWLRLQPEVVHVQALSDTVKRLNKNMHGDDPSYYRLPTSQALAAQYLLLYEMSLPYGLDLNDLINVDKSATRVGVTLDNLTSVEIIAFENRARDWLENNAPSLVSYGASPSIMFAHIGQKNIVSMLIGAALALILISMILIIALRSVKYGLISLVPNIVPVGVAFGVWGYFVGEVGLGLSVVSGMTLGIVVDDTVHFMSKYIRARREKNLSADDAVKYAFDQVGVALLVTTIILVAGFLILAQSAFKVNGDTGLMAAITITIALIIDFLLLPALLLAASKRRVKETTS